MTNTREKKWYVCRKLRIWELLLKYYAILVFFLVCESRSGFQHSVCNHLCAACYPTSSWEAFALFYLPNSLFLFRIYFTSALSADVILLPIMQNVWIETVGNPYYRRYTSIYRLEIRKWLVTRFSFLSTTKKIFNIIIHVVIFGYI